MKHAKPEAIKAARRRYGLTQEQAAAVIGYGYRAWQEWEGGRKPMRMVLLEAFVKAVSK